MNISMNKGDLKDYLSKPYQGSKSFLAEVIFPIFGNDGYEDKFNTPILDNQPENRAFADAVGIQSIEFVGVFYVGIEPLEIFDISISDRVLMERNRVGVQKLIRRFLRPHSCAFMIFHYENETRWDWRFSYCHIRGRNEDSTDSRRYTFLLGPGQSCRTAAENFMSIYEKRGNIAIADIEQAFNVEALSKEFFNKYKHQYEKFVGYLAEPANGLRERFADSSFDHAGMSNEKIREREEKPLRDYVKKLLGRIVFLHFLQKKGWLGVPKDGDWGEGDRNFMLHLYQNASIEQKENFLDAVLKPLFSGALDVDRSNEHDIFDTGVIELDKIRIPYLNGGLFESDKLDDIPCKFPVQFFGDLLEMLSEYNFTIDENDPDDAEVGVDPEMLGRIFENLLEDNKDKGAYYTPKEIVQYMCRESLIAYLQTDYGDSDKERIRKFVLTHDADEIQDIAGDIDNRLKEVKICDPAIGSGAFPMGLLRELFLCRCAIEPNAASNAADVKRHIIQNNIYGVDIERGAVDIARLRFWLSLIVDEAEPITLPNLDFKIMQGNSLLECYMGIDLSNISGVDVKGQGQIMFDDENCNQALIQKYIGDYFEENDHLKRQFLRDKIDQAVKNLIIANNSSIEEQVNSLDLQNNSHFFLWHTYFKDVFSRPSKEGFDIVIGNPPYGAKYDEQTKKDYKNVYSTAKNIKGKQKASLDTYTLFIELGYNILKINGSFAYIVPISLTSSDSLTGIHNILMNNCQTVHISSYAVRPKPVFENAVVNTSILLFHKTGTPCQHLYSTKMYRRGGQEFDLQKLIENIHFVDVKSFVLYGRIPKIGTLTEKNILTKLFGNKRLSSFIDDKCGRPIYYRTTGGRYFKVVTNYSTGSTKETSINLKKDVADSIGCILSSSLAFWFYQIYSNNLDWRTYEIENFTIPQLSLSNIVFLNGLYSRYLIDIEENANLRTTSEGSSYNVDSFKEYKIVRSKPIIDEIDDYICPLYGLTIEETAFIKNYELEFRLSGE